MRYVAALTLVLVGSAGLAAAQRPRVAPAVALKAESFDLRDVRLLDGPFKHAMDLDLRYLASLPPDRLLHNFRVAAGLPSSAEPLGGWEEPNSEVRGHFVGHYLTACAMAFRATGDPVIKANADRVVAGMAECQARFPSGYLSAFPETFFDRLERLQPVWVPWYTLHKVYQGLLDMHTLAGNTRALDVLRKAAAWAIARTDRLSDDQLQKVLNTEHGGINEVFANLYAETGDKAYLSLAKRLHHRAVLDPLIKGEDRLTGLHANTQFPKVIGIARIYELTGDKALRAGAEYFWNTVTRDRSYVIGGNSDGEVFSPKESLSQHMGTSSTETCNTYNMLRLTRHLFQWNASAEQADYYERALYNHILASQHPVTGMMSYYVPLRTGSSRPAKTPFGYSEPFSSFWCCTGTGVENHVGYGSGIYWRDGSRGVYVSLFIASELTWQAKGVTIRQTTSFPDEPRTRLEISCRRPTRLAVHIRRPAWAGDRFAVSVNGSSARMTAGARSGFVTVERTWRTGDVLAVELPMALHTEAFRDDPKKVALLYGPIVLCAETTAGNDNAFVVGTAPDAAASLKAVAGRPLEFTGPGAVFRQRLDGQAAPVVFRPFFREADRPYAVYWDVLDAAGWASRQADHAREVERLRALDRRTVDVIAVGDPESEAAHGLAGERTASGPFGSRRWRHADNGGWFAYAMKVAPNAAQTLVVTLWGSDAGARTFDVLADGATLRTITLANNAPGRFYDVEVPLPSEVLAGKQKIVVRFQARPANFAGGVFGLRVVLSQAPDAP